MRKLTSAIVVALLAVPMAACDEQPTELARDTEVTPNQEVKASQGTSPGNSGMLAEPTWGDDHRWRFLIPKSVSDGPMVFAHPSNEAAAKPLYQIGPAAGDDGAHHTEPVPHDHVTTVPGENEGSSTAICHLTAVFPTPGAVEGEDVATSGPPIPPAGGLLQAHAADIDGDDEPEDLTSAEKVQAAETQEHVFLVSTPLVFPCPLKDIEG